MAALSYASDLQRLMLGLGLGVMGALSEALESSPLDFSSTESYLLQIAVEAGLLGLLLFVAMLVSALRRPGHPGQPALSPLLFLAIFVNAIFTPALYGFGNAALAGLLLAHTRRNP
jgi:O-antigen ligase